MKKIILPLILFVIVLVLGFTVQKVPTAPQPDEVQGDTPAIEEEGIVELSKAFIPFPETPYTQVSVAYPVLSDEMLTARFKDEAEERVGAFKSESTLGRYPGEIMEYTLRTEYERFDSLPYTTYVFTNYIYTGGAHGNQFRTTTTFDVTGRIISLDTLFTDVDSALVPIALYAKASRADSEFSSPEWLMGLDPNVSSYERFILRADSIEFLFDPYHIAPYSSGPQSIIVPKSVYQDFIR